MSDPLIYTTSLLHRKSKTVLRGPVFATSFLHHQTFQHRLTTFLDKTRRDWSNCISTFKKYFGILVRRKNPTLPGAQITNNKHSISNLFITEIILYMPSLFFVTKKFTTTRGWQAPLRKPFMAVLTTSIILYTFSQR